MMDRPRYEVWRSTSRGLVRVRTFRRRWVACLYAWEHTRRGWFTYAVRDTGAVHGWVLPADCEKEKR